MVAKGTAGGGNGRFDLEERTARFGEAAIAFAAQAPGDGVGGTFRDQFVRAATSVGANYGEANEGESRKDFRHKIAICRKEARESRHWLRMFLARNPELAPPAAPLVQEAKELHLIFCAIMRTLDRNGP